jgi:hypothetical protein
MVYKFRYVVVRLGIPGRETDGVTRCGTASY